MSFTSGFCLIADWRAQNDIPLGRPEDDAHLHLVILFPQLARRGEPLGRVEQVEHSSARRVFCDCQLCLQSAPLKTCTEHSGPEMDSLGFFSISNPMKKLLVYTFLYSCPT